MSKTASEYFAEVPRRYNCAQSVAAGAGREDLVPELAAMGGGRAPEGLCGALYAALQLLPEAERESARNRFQQQTGAIRCHDLKTKGVPCPQCVALAAELLNKVKGK